MNPRKPTNIKLVQGTYRADRAAKNEPRPPIEIPEIPDHLEEGAKAEWVRLSQDLAAIGLLTKIDRAALATYCSAWAFAKEAERGCYDEDGKPRMFIKTAAGNIIENPFFSAWKRSVEIMHKFLVEFGMTPASRTKIDASPLPAGKPGNPFGSIK